MMLEKLAADNSQVDSDTLLTWANMAKNSVQMWNGFSSHQLVFGKNPNVPNIMQAELPALEGSTTSETFFKHLNALHEARKAFKQMEASGRIRQALRSKVRAAEQIYENGDNVFYKREGKEWWLGPGKVVFQDGKVMFVRHESYPEVDDNDNDTNSASSQLCISKDQLNVLEEGGVDTSHDHKSDNSPKDDSDGGHPHCKE
uniref:Uncharacterized protein n=1 Tax=Octopus bimaculoides TaxID=37653 RepID=A0A0L8HML4_OCTBM